MKYKDTYHLIQSSPWPFVTSFNLLSLILTGLSGFSSYISYSLSLWLGIFLFLLSLLYWFLDINQESYSGDHSLVVNSGLSFGFLLFLLSESALFFSFFFALFFLSLIPDITLGSIWPPLGITPFEFHGVPLLNTLILISSGLALTSSHNLLSSLPNLSFKTFLYSSFLLFITILLGLIFSFFQYFEYWNSPFTMSDSVYGNLFFLLTGFHGFHIFAGTLLLLLSLLHLLSSLSTPSSPKGDSKLFSYSAIYWHFVDVIWLFLFFFLYIL